MIAEIIFIALFLGLYLINCPLYVIFSIFLLIYWIPKIIFVRFLEFIYPQVITRFNSKMKIALTFDDMPDGYHEEIIKLLDKHGMKGTLFVISGQINDSNIGIFVDAVKNGHQLGNHGRTNSAHFFKNNDQLRAEIMVCDNMIKLIYQMANVPLPITMCYRPGCGLFGPEMLKIAKEFGYRLALGSVYPNDTIVRSSFINHFYIMSHIRAGDVVILHDRKWTPKLLETLLVSLWFRGLYSVPLSELCNPLAR